MRRLLLLLPLLLGLTIPDAPPPPLELTEDELRVLAKDDIAVRLEGSETGGGAIGIVDIDAPPAAVWGAIMDLEARVAEIGGLKGVERYVDEPTNVGARWDLKMFGIGVVFHILYDLDPDAYWCTYELDTTKDNDLVAVVGAYQILPQGDGSRLIYRSETDSGRKVPQWIKRWLTSGSLKEQLGGVRGRAEAAVAGRPSPNR